jgi:hypothetical protein
LPPRTSYFPASGVLGTEECLHSGATRLCLTTNHWRDCLLCICSSRHPRVRARWPATRAFPVCPWPSSRTFQRRCTEAAVPIIRISEQAVSPAVPSVLPHPFQPFAPALLPWWQHSLLTARRLPPPLQCRVPTQHQRLWPPTQVTAAATSCLRLLPTQKRLPPQAYSR